MGFFKSLFGPSRDEIWNALGAQIGGEIIPATFWKGQKLQAEAGGWTVTLDEYTVTSVSGKVPVMISYTRMRAPFPNPTGFRFSIHRASVLSHLGTLLGMQDVQVGYPEFDDAFVIKGNDETLLKRLCRSDRLRNLVAAQPSFRIGVRDDEGFFGTRYPSDVDVLIFEVAEQIRDVARLRGLYDVFAEALDGLTKIGVTSRSAGR